MTTDSTPSNSTSKTSFPLISVNWHLWPRCIHQCKFCFGKFNEINRVLNKEDALRIPHILKNFGTQKLSFTGGEPLLCSYLGDLIRETKQVGITTMLITSGTLLTEGFLNKYKEFIDWIGLSIDSSRESVQYLLGRGSGNHIRKVKEIAKLIHKSHIKLKINTVVTRLNWEENMSALITDLSPERWKVFQVLPIEGQNNDSIESLLITEKQFDYFVKNHLHLNPVFETNEDMTGSYLMLDALGRFFQNSKGYLEYSSSILHTNPIVALNQVGWDASKFKKRGGIYNWRINRNEGVLL